MTRGISDNELSPRSCKIPVGDVDRNLLFTLCLQTIRQQRQVNILLSTAPAALLDRLHLIFKNGLRVIQQSSDERTFPVIHTSDCRKPEQIQFQVVSVRCTVLIVQK